MVLAMTGMKTNSGQGRQVQTELRVGAVWTPIILLKAESCPSLEKDYRDKVCKEAGAMREHSGLDNCVEVKLRM